MWCRCYELCGSVRLFSRNGRRRVQALEIGGEVISFMEIVYGHLPGLREMPVYLPHHLVYLTPEGLVLRNVLATRHQDQNEGDVATKFLILLERVTERVQPFRYALGVIQTVHAEDDTTPSQLVLQLSRSLTDLLRTRRLREITVVNADGKAPHPNVLTSTRNVDD